MFHSRRHRLRAVLEPTLRQRLFIETFLCGIVVASCLDQDDIARIAVLDVTVWNNQQQAALARYDTYAIGAIRTDNRS